VWLPASVKVFGHTQVSIMGSVRVFPHAEEVDLATDLLAPLAVAVRRQRE
jgi:hypothetical protein